MIYTPQLLLDPKSKEREKDFRKSSLNIDLVVVMVYQWLLGRKAVFVDNQDYLWVAALTGKELLETKDHKEKEGLPGYMLLNELHEFTDTAFLASTLIIVLSQRGEFFDLTSVITKANGQSGGSGSLDRLIEVAHNMNGSTKDLEHFWTLIVSYAINMKVTVNFSQVLNEYTLPKNNGNWSEKYFDQNELFLKFYGRDMEKYELLAHHSHAKKAMKIIREFIKTYVDPSVEDTGLRPEHHEPYRLFILNFIRFPEGEINVSPQEALLMLQRQLESDYADEVAAAGGIKEKILIPGQDTVVTQ